MLGTGRLRMSKSKLDKNRSDCKIEGWCRCFGEVAVGDGLIICMTTHVHAGIGVTVAGSAAPRMIMNCSVRHICRALPLGSFWRNWVHLIFTGVPGILSKRQRALFQEAIHLFSALVYDRTPQHIRIHDFAVSGDQLRVSQMLCADEALRTAKPDVHRRIHINRPVHRRRIPFCGCPERIL